MANTIYTNYPPDLVEDQKDYLIQTVKDWSIQNGLIVRPNPIFVNDEINPAHVLATNAPVTLFPSPFPKACFLQARSLQQWYNELYAAISDDEEWLENVIQDILEDTFIAQLWKIHQAVKEEGYVQDITLGLFRSDYMVNIMDEASAPSLKQVEFNTISSSFGGLATKVTQLHTELASYPNLARPFAYPDHPLFNKFEISDSEPPTQPIRSDGLPPVNDAIPTLAAGIVAAHKAYGPSKCDPPLPTAVIILVQDNERNIFDQIILTDHVQKLSPKTPVFRLPTSKILSQTMIPDSKTNPSRPLIYTPPASPTTPFEITLVYFRALYSPTEYNTPTSWAARHHLERSAAIKCPTVLLHLSGSKKIQQVLASTEPDHISSFLPTIPSATLTSLRSTFAPQYSLAETSNSQPSPTPTPTGLSLALNPTTAQNHVLKPQREGGGNNIYRTSIPTFLASLPPQNYKQYILMELITPPAAARNTALRSDGQVVTGDVISELGIFGACLWQKKPKKEEEGGEKGYKKGRATGDKDRTEILWNTEGGYLLRTKARDSDEGGVAAGFSSLDSLILYE